MSKPSCVSPLSPVTSLPGQRHCIELTYSLRFTVYRFVGEAGIEPAPKPLLQEEHTITPLFPLPGIYCALVGYR